ncbi:hypothetical protein NHX12_003452 [Muraenolepis orangiensis]|uniref:Uncharacterized protein n=1 Tax=Muraenolepis orangiensis TaxID=630683 RepID=A0A9Q0DYE8_9TELE|nr:hypothetical protein NHX12_003452 [Muraenolepis orangiensis]
MATQHVDNRHGKLTGGSWTWVYGRPTSYHGASYGHRKYCDASTVQCISRNGIHVGDESSPGRPCDVSSPLPGHVADEQIHFSLQDGTVHMTSVASLQRPPPAIRSGAG